MFECLSQLENLGFEKAKSYKSTDVITIRMYN
jgi:hypothetical protein